MRAFLIIFIATFFIASIASATTVNLTDGRSVQGVISKRDAKSIEINTDGVAMTYYADEIKDIDGQPFAAAAAETPRESAAMPQTPVAASAPQEASAPAQNTPVSSEKRDLILKFIDVFGTRQALMSNFQLMIDQIQKEKPDEAQKIRDRVKVDEIIDRLVPVYDRNFTADDLNAFIAFYSSSEGQKLIKTMPVLMRESVQESVKYMEEKFPTESKVKK